MFYDIFLSLCKEKNVTPAQVRQDLGISQSTMASWKSRNLTPNAITLIHLANYFHTSPAYLMGNKLAKEPLHDFEMESMPASIGEIDVSQPDMHGYNYYQYYDPVAISSEKLMNQLVKSFNKLNRHGKTEAVRRIRELTLLSEYTQPDPANKRNK